jgi:hypothetical protein
MKQVVGWLWMGGAIGQANGCRCTATSERRWSWWDCHCSWSGCAFGSAPASSIPEPTNGGAEGRQLYGAFSGRKHKNLSKGPAEAEYPDAISNRYASRTVTIRPSRFNVWGVPISADPVGRGSGMSI